MRVLFQAFMLAVCGAIFPMSATGAVVAHWTFDNGSITLDGNNNVATAADTTGAHNATATVAGTATGVSVTGRFGAGLQLNNVVGTQATNQYYLTFPNLTELMGPSGGSYSVAAWVNIASANTNNNAIVADWGNAPAGNRFDYWFTVNNGQVRAQSRASNTPNDDIFARQPAAPTVNDAQWRHIAWTWDKAAATLTSYVDGVQIDQLTAVAPPLDLMVSDSAVGAIGRKADTNQHFSGSMDEVWVATGVFTPATVQSLFFLNQIPEPCSVGLLGAGAVLWCGWRRRRSA
jgi:Concanavalin A-like lectin/glucanases superfamily